MYSFAGSVHSVGTGLPWPKRERSRQIVRSLQNKASGPESMAHPVFTGRLRVNVAKNSYQQIAWPEINSICFLATRKYPV